MAAGAFDVVIVHESDVDDWVKRLVRGLERGGLRTTTVEAATVDRVLSDPAITEAPILVVAVGRKIEGAIRAADAICGRSDALQAAWSRSSCREPCWGRPPSCVSAPAAGLST